MKTIHGKLLFDNPQDIEILKDLTRRWSSAYRYAYKRLLEGVDLNTLRKTLQELFNLNARYAHSAIVKAQAWRVLKVVALTALSPEASLRDVSTLKKYLLWGKWGDPLRAQFLLQGVGT